MPFLATLGAGSLGAYRMFKNITVTSISTTPYIEDYFSATLYQGTGSSLIVNTGVSLSNTGNSEWQTTLFVTDSPGYTIGLSSFDTDSAGNFYLRLGGALTKTDSNFANTWSIKNPVDGTFGLGAIAVDSSNSWIYTAGTSGSPSNSYIGKISTSNGNIIWGRRLSTGASTSWLGTSALTAVKIGQSGVYAIGHGSYYNGSNYVRSAFIYKYDYLGNQIWQKRKAWSSGSTTHTAYALQIDSSDNIYVFLRIDNTAYISKLNSSGVEQWTRNINNPGGSIIYTTAYNYNSLALDDSGNIYLCVFTYPDGNSLVKLNNNGVFQWAKRIGTQGWDAVCTTDGTNVYYMNSTEWRTVAKFDPSGNKIWAKNMSSRSSYSLQYSHAGIFWRNGYLYLLGTDSSSGDDNENYASLIKMKDDGTGISSNAFAFVKMADSVSVITTNVVTGVSNTDGALSWTDFDSNEYSVSNTLSSQAYTTLNYKVLVPGGGMVWIKNRSGANNHVIYDTQRGTTMQLIPHSTGAQTTVSTGVTEFGTGVTISTAADVNTIAANNVVWCFRKRPKFFDMVTFTGTSSTNQRVNHSLGSEPGLILVKTTDVTGSWWVYHRSQGRSKYAQLESNAGFTALTNAWGTSDPTSTDFGISSADFGLNTRVCIAYLFAHNAGDFGEDGTANVISCGTFTSDGSDRASVDLGWEPQFVLMKPSSTTGNWWVVDNKRGFTLDDNRYFTVNGGTAGEATGTGIRLRSNGFYQQSTTGSTATYIYMAIRRGMMKTPTNGYQVFTANTRTGVGKANTIVTTNSFNSIGYDMSPDLYINFGRASGAAPRWYDRVRGYGKTIFSSGNAIETTDPTDKMIGFDAPDGIRANTDTGGSVNGSTVSILDYHFKRANGFFDIVCYTGTGVTNRNLTHNLGVAPQLLFIKARNNVQNWNVLCTLNSGLQGILDSTAALSAPSASIWGDGTSYVAPTSTVFTVGSDNATNASTWTYVAYLFASVPKVSKIGTYTGTGTTKQVDCGFSNGARFVMIKRTDSTGDWYVWDFKRGIVAGNDPYFLFNAAANEVTSTDYVDTFAGGFELSSTAPTALNANGGTYLFFAIA